MTATTYIRYELLRTARNRRLLFFSIGFPALIYLLVAGPNRDVGDLDDSGVSAPLYFMASLAAFGAMNAVLGAGARIALDRTSGWQRQLRVTPLAPREYLGAKLLGGYLSAGLTMVVLDAAGVALGVRLPAGDWVTMTGLLLVGLLPFAALGVLLGHLVGADAVGPAVGGLTALLAFLGGVWFPVGSGVMHDVALGLPSYWLVQAGRTSVGGAAWGATGWLVVAAWTVVPAVAAAHAYRRDAERA
jgi:ABC-2 type transport system permease protein